MTEYESFNLRSSSDDQVYTMLRDGFSQQVLREFTDVDYGAYRPAVVFINGEYWGIHNIRYWKSSEPPYNRWRWIVFDRDQSFLPQNLHRNSLEMATSSTGTGWPNPPWSTVLFRRLLTNAEFRNQFIQIYAYQMNTTFEPERVIRMIDYFEANIADEMLRHIERWGVKRDADTKEAWIPPAVESMNARHQSSNGGKLESELPESV